MDVFFTNVLFLTCEILISLFSIVQPIKKFIHECQILQTSTTVFNRLKNGGQSPTNVGTPQSSMILNIECRITLYANKLLNVKASNSFV